MAKEFQSCDGLCIVLALLFSILVHSQMRANVGQYDLLRNGNHCTGVGYSVPETHCLKEWDIDHLCLGTVKSHTGIIFS